MTEKPQYHEGGYVTGPTSGDESVPIQLSRGHALMSYASYKALGPEGVKELFPNTDFELVLSSDDVRELGPQALERLQQELEEL